ncbi:MAG TPA: EamA family transporter, partial [Halomonas sp.]|nr:EamA family transporter [Halomonas sp.]
MAHAASPLHRCVCKLCARLAFLLNEAAMLPSAPRDPEAVKGVMFGLTAYT